ncbi:hypothetical protein EMPG_09319 [Blastomyces silverae]|uniref:Disintegrin and metalloproteinase domain-containing protein B n=1 Tax=Blastomyces silverae TaxID=2060906 RepID=A0A0H1B334_9EURO|nr:hypothetical protein EMPG_09319 [Blastomyces silverae]
MRFFGGLVPLLTSVLAILASNVDARSERRDHIGHISLIEQPIIHTPSHRVNALSHFDITFELHKRQQRLKLSLEPNHDILPDGAQVHFVDQAGNVERSEFIKRQDHKVFRGWSWIQVGDGNWERAGWARVTIKQDGPNPLFEGVFTVMHEHHNILLRSSYAQSKHELDKNVDDTTAEYMIVFRDSDMGHLMEDDDVTKRSSAESRPCQADDLPFNSDPNHPIFRPVAERGTSLWSPMSLDSIFGLNRRQSDMPGEGGNAGGVNLVSSIGSTAGCPSTRKVALIGVATDCSYIQSFGSQQQATRENVISVVNSASQLYEETFNISLGLKNLTVVAAECPATPPASAAWNAACGDGPNSLSLSQRLNLFSAWRGQQQDDLAFWTLMSNCRTSAEVGLAWLGQLCNREVRGNPDPSNSSSQAVTGANVIARTTNEWQVFAHEVGHTFGAVHDCDDGLCARSQSLTSQCCPFSQNSCSANGRFIMNPTSRMGITQFSSCTVGNICSSMGRNSVRSDCLVNNRGVVTIAGSQCGNGIVEEGEDCDCGGEASCRDNPCCDAQTCKFKDNAVCDDSNEDCCNNCQFQSSDTVCRPSSGPCDPEENGQCTSRDHQCRTLMGSLLGGNDTFACDDQTCVLACSSPSLPRNTCSSLRQNFLDGTPCASGGRCQNGVCEGSSFKSWIDNNKPLVIGLAAGLGGLFLLSIFGCIIRRCRRPRRRKSMAPMTQGAVFSPPPRGLPGWRQPQPRYLLLYIFYTMSVGFLESEEYKDISLYFQPLETSFECKIGELASLRGRRHRRGCASAPLHWLQVFIAANELAKLQHNRCGWALPRSLAGLVTRAGSSTAMDALCTNISLANCASRIKMKRRRYCPEDYSVGWICALAIELAAAQGMLDEEHEDFGLGTDDSHIYKLGRIGGHNVAIAWLPEGQTGTNSAATTATRMKSIFPSIRFGLMVGVGGGVPSAKSDIRLGDVVVGRPDGVHGGVVQYDFGKDTPDGFVRTGHLNSPPQILLEAIAKVKANHIGGLRGIDKYASKIADSSEFSRNNVGSDLLFEPDYDHPGGETCEHCDVEKVVKRQQRKDQRIIVHYGTIASGNRVMRSGAERDALSSKLGGVLCFEMEAAGLLNSFPCLVIRGICDYSDSHKNKSWQPYAAGVAAAYAKEVLSVIPPVKALQPNVDVRIREYYMNNRLLEIKRLSGELLDMDRCYINLVITEHSQENVLKGAGDEQMERESSPFTLLNRLKVGQIDSKRAVCLPELFDERKRPDGSVYRPKRIMIRGRAGIGKTTLCKKIVHDFLDGKIWSDRFRHIFWVPLRELKGRVSFREFLREEYFSMDGDNESLTSALLTAIRDENTLLLLDGFDEISGERNASGIGLAELFKDLLNTRNAIVTSRPYAANPPNLLPFDLDLETVGFHPDQVQAYVTRVVDDQQTLNKIQTFIKSHSLIQGLVQIPIQLDALCYTWDDDFVDGEIPETMTTLYEAIELKLWKKDILQVKEGGREVPLSEHEVQNLHGRQQIDEEIGQTIKLLEVLAFVGLHNDAIDFHKAHRQKIYKRSKLTRVSDNNLEKLSFLRTSDSSARRKDMSYHFIHLTFQEFFAAQYFTRCWVSGKPLLCLKLDTPEQKGKIETTPEEFLQREKYNGRYDIFWRFVTGLLNSSDGNQLCEFFRKLEGEPRDLLGPTHQRLLMHCFSEVPSSANDSYIRDLRVKMEDGCYKWSLREMKLLNRMYLCREAEFPDRILNEIIAKESDGIRAVLLDALAFRPQLSRDIVDGIIPLLQDIGRGVGRSASRALKGRTDLAEDVSQFLIHLLKSCDRVDRFSVSHTLRDWDLPEAALQTLMHLLKDSDPYVQSSAAYALGDQVILPEATVQTLIHLLNNDDSHVQLSASGALQSQTNLSEDALQTLIHLLNSDSAAQFPASQILKKQANLSEAALQTLVHLLKDSDPDVQASAVYALGDQVNLPEAAVKTVIHLLKNDHPHVRFSVRGVLERQTNLSADSLQTLIHLMKNESTARFLAAEALGNRANLSEATLQTLIHLLKNSDLNIQISAVRVLAGQTKLPEAALQTLIHLIRKGGPYFRNSVTDILKTRSNLSENILQTLMLSLKQSSAVSALQYQAQLADTLPAQIHRLTREHADMDVQSSAAHALKAQTNLPEDSLRMLMQLLKNADGEISVRIEDRLYNNDFYSIILSSFNVSTVSVLYWVWVREGIQRQFSCYVQDGKLFIGMPEGRRGIMLEQKEDVLQAFNAGALAMEALTHLPDDTWLDGDGSSHSGHLPDDTWLDGDGSSHSGHLPDDTSLDGDGNSHTSLRRYVARFSTSTKIAVVNLCYFLSRFRRRVWGYCF